MGRFGIEDQARQLLPEGSHLQTSHNAHYARGVHPDDVGTWDNITFKSNNNVPQDYIAAGELMGRLDRAGVPVNVNSQFLTNKEGAIEVLTGSNKTQQEAIEQLWQGQPGWINPATS
ncbi:MAG: hypothetical protein ACK5T0_01350 [Vampirovibrionales bacterium]